MQHVLWTTAPGHLQDQGLQQEAQHDMTWHAWPGVVMKGHSMTQHAETGAVVHPARAFGGSVWLILAWQSSCSEALPMQ